ncbi:phospholipase D delta-like isoform X2 [Rutidosis leptorrhynchoides]|uniref:phospholipase D delta-like isoform X2 n=1 Tax=Rutidosis leptorrhynchoides TaxID=125765 RepID=UPI003A998DDA
MLILEINMRINYTQNDTSFDPKFIKRFKVWNDLGFTAFQLQEGTKAPRQPWHDLHCKIEGPAAYDVLLNFEQRWRKTTKWREFALVAKRMAHWQDDALLKIVRISWIASPRYVTP